jgi:hypothetical protein
MKKMYFLLLLISGMALFTETSAQATKTGSLKDLAFIEGHWKAMLDDKTIEGVWLAPAGDNFIGMMRMMKGDKADLYEILAYEQTDKGLVSLVKHFAPGLVGWEDKDKQDRYRFLDAGNGWVNLEKEDGSLRIRYEKRSKNQFVILRGNEKDGKWEYKDLFVFNRVK